MYAVEELVTKAFLEQTKIVPLATQKAIFRRSQGIPRMINRLALESLHQGCLEGTQVITEELFAHVFVSDDVGDMIRI